MALALILHAHLPYVRHPEYPEFYEEDWLFEAITDTYLPLLEIFDRLLVDNVSFVLTLTLTPTLCAMLQDSLLQNRYLDFLSRSIELGEKEVIRTKGKESSELARFYLARLNSRRDQFVQRHQKDLVSAFRHLQDRGCIEIITSGVTHGFLPLLQPIEQSVRAQVR